MPYLVASLCQHRNFHVGWFLRLNSYRNMTHLWLKLFTNFRSRSSWTQGILGSMSNYGTIIKYMFPMMHNCKISCRRSFMLPIWNAMQGHHQFYWPHLRKEVNDFVRVVLYANKPRNLMPILEDYLSHFRFHITFGKRSWWPTAYWSMSTSCHCGETLLVP